MATGERLKREAAGRYVSADGRFTVEQSSGRWMTVDAEETDDLGLPLVRGPFATLDEARDAIEAARTEPRPASDLASRAAARPRSKPAGARGRGAQGAAPSRSTGGRGAKTPAKPREPVLALREYESADGDALRALWKAAGFRSDGDDDRSLAAFAKRNPGLLIVATADGAIVASALGAWDGRRGWLYHVATDERFRRQGIATRLVHRLEQRLRTAGAPKVSAIVRDENRSAHEFWEKLGYEAGKSRNLRKEL
jgi:ribosomal protein S18 acetylase RimI-like enzyme